MGAFVLTLPTLLQRRLTSLILFAFVPLAAQGGVSAEQAEFFEKKIRPLLAEKCYECHSAEKKIKGGLALDTKMGVLNGGDAGAALVPGAPDKSRIIEAVRYLNRDLQMPPKGALSAEQIQDLEDWVKMGAPDPREASVTASAGKRVINMEEGRRFWSFKPLYDPALPEVKNTAWEQAPMDRFILASLEKVELSPAQPADRRTLIRRATFDLTGLPPTLEEVEAFLADNSPNAFDRVIERLLASPQYGERWGRHWLDVARYADSNGMDENVAYGHAWRYRDYVVKSFNDNKPYGEFLMQQIAGDLLPYASEEQRVENLAATGYLAIGARVLAEPDVQKMEMDIIDEQIDSLGKAFLGMTFGCCRCHDHKFDPVPTADYYALAAIFKSTKSLSEEKMGAIKFWYEHSMATPDQTEAKKKHDALVAAQNSKLNQLTTKLRNELKSELHGNAARYLAAAVALPADAEFSEVEKVAKANQLRPRYLLTCRQYLARAVYHPFFKKWHELAPMGQADVVLGHYSPLFSQAIAGAAKVKAPAKLQEPALAAAYDALNDIAGFLAIPDKDANAFDGEMLADVEQMRNEVMKVERQAPDPPALMGVKDGVITKSLPIHIRGSYLTLGKPIERGFPEVMRASLNSKLVLPARQSGRLELARWMASSEHPLTARVMVNRLWRWHFGAGLVKTTDNFGTLGEKPSHPELLDWLARRFIESGWSVKDMHRLMMKSATYQMASAHSSAGQPSSGDDPLLVDPENRLLWRANLQRLEAEQIRDAMLAASGSLSLEMGGKTVPLRNREFVFNHTSKDRTQYETPRRALYLPIIRNHLYDMLEQFDFPDPTMPTGSRNATVVAPQALILLNAPVVMQSAERLAQRLARESKTDDARLQKAYSLLYARTPTAREVERAKAFLASQPEPMEAWTRLCHTLLAANEFMYLR